MVAEQFSGMSKIELAAFLGAAQTRRLLIRLTHQDEAPISSKSNAVGAQ